MKSREEWNKSERSFSPLRSLRENNKLYVHNRPYRNQSDEGFDVALDKDGNIVERPNTIRSDLYNNYKKDAYQLTLEEKQLQDFLVKKAVNNPNFKYFNITDIKQDKPGMINPGGYDYNNNNINIYDYGNNSSRLGLFNKGRIANHEFAHMWSDLETKAYEPLEQYIDTFKGQEKKQLLNNMKNIVDRVGAFQSAYKSDNYAPSHKNMQLGEWGADEYTGHFAGNIRHPLTKSSDKNANIGILKLLNNIQNNFDPSDKDEYPELIQILNKRLNELNDSPNVTNRDSDEGVFNSRQVIQPSTFANQQPTRTNQKDHNLLGMSRDNSLVNQRLGSLQEQTNRNLGVLNGHPAKGKEYFKQNGVEPQQTYRFTPGALRGLTKNYRIGEEEDSAYEGDTEGDKMSKGGSIYPHLYRHMAKGGSTTSGDPFAEFGGYEVKTSTPRAINTDDPFAEFGGYEVKKLISKPTKKEDNWGSLVGKSLANVGQGIADLPSNLLKGIESAGDYMEKKRFERTGEKSRQLMGKPSSYVPEVGTMAKKRLGIGEVETGDNVFKKLASTGIEYGTPAGILGLAGKGAKLTGALSSGARAAGLGATVAAGEEMGVSPIVTEAAALSKGSVKRLAGKLVPAITKTQRLKVAEKKVANLLENYGTLGGGNLKNITNFDEKAKRLVTPTTAEVAQNTGISHLHNASSGTLASVGNKMTANDAILNKELHKIGKDLKLDQVEMSTIARNQIEANLNKATTKRTKESAPLYKKLDEDTTRVKHTLDKTIDQSASKEIGDIRAKLEKLKTILPEAQKSAIAPLEKRLAALNENSLGKFTSEHKDLSAKIAHMKETATPAQLDKMITIIGEKIAKLKESPSANGTLIKRYTEAKKALEADLMSTASGNAARQKYKDLSTDVNKIERDKLLKKFTDKDKYGEHKAPVDKLLDNVLSAPLASVKAYGAQIKGTKAEKVTSAFIRDKYLGAAETGLPTYHKSKQWLQTYGNKAKELLTPEDYKRILDTKVYLNNRNKVTTANKSINSLTSEKDRGVKTIVEHLGEEYSEGWFKSILKEGGKMAANAIPGVGQTIKSGINSIDKKRNIAYQVLEEAMTDPVVAKRLLQSLKPADAKKVKSLLPTIILNKINNNNMEN